jgi:hypothetical protein
MIAAVTTRIGTPCSTCRKEEFTMSKQARSMEAGELARLHVENRRLRGYLGKAHRQLERASTAVARAELELARAADQGTIGPPARSRGWV